jgi:cytochrome P450
VDIFDWMQRLTLDIISLVAYGKNFDSLNDPNSDVVQLYNSLMHDLQKPLFMLLPWLQKLWFIPFIRDITNRLDKFDAFMFQIIADKEKEVRDRLARGESKPENEMDLLERMIEASLNDGTLTREDLRANTLIFFVAVCTNLIMLTITLFLTFVQSDRVTILPQVP